MYFQCLSMAFEGRGNTGVELVAPMTLSVLGRITKAYQCQMEVVSKSVFA